MTNKTFHQKLRRHRGKASQFRCFSCGAGAYEWAYQYTNPEPLFDEVGSPWSLDFDDYAPMCRSCHRKLDYRMNPGVLAAKRAQMQSLVGSSEEMSRRARIGCLKRAKAKG